MLPAGKSAGQHLWMKQKMPIRGACRANRMGSTPLTGLLKPIMNNRMTIGPSYSILVLAKWSIAKCSTSSSHLASSFYFQCKDETDLFSRCFEYPAHACHIAQESQRYMSVTAVLTNIGIVPKRLPAFLNASCGTVRCKNEVPHICHAFRTCTWCKGRVQHGLVIRRCTI